MMAWPQNWSVHPYAQLEILQGRGSENFSAGIKLGLIDIYWIFFALGEAQ